MKKTFVKTVSQIFIPALIVSASLFAFAPEPTIANNSNFTIEILSNENTASVKYAGSTDNALLLDLNVNNPKGDKFMLVIQDSDGIILFQKEYADASFSKQIKILKDENDAHYNISIRSSNKNLEHSFA